MEQAHISLSLSHTLWYTHLSYCAALVTSAAYEVCVFVCTYNMSTFGIWPNTCVCEIFVFAPAWTPVLICYCTYKRVILSAHLHMSTEYALITLSMDAYKPPCVQQ